MLSLPAALPSSKTLEGALWHKLSGPLSAMLMPILGAVAAFGLARSGKLFVRAVIGMALGFTYFVADNFALAMGSLGAYPRSEEHTSELQSLMRISNAVFGLKTKKQNSK